MQSMIKITLPNGAIKDFEADMNDDIYGEFEDDFDEEDLDMLDGGENFEDYGFEENWN